MEKQNNLDKGDIETLHLVLQEMLEEQKLARQVSDTILFTSQQLLDKTDAVEKRIIDLSKSIDAKENSIFQSLSKEIKLIKLLVTGRPQPIVRKFQILLFPERDAELFYKIVFGRWFLWIIACLLAGCLLKWELHRSDNQKEIELRRLETNTIVNAWNYLYSQKSKDLHRRMDSALLRAEHPNNGVSR